MFDFLKNLLGKNEEAVSSSSALSAGTATAVTATPKTPAPSPVPLSKPAPVPTPARVPAPAPSLGAAPVRFSGRMERVLLPLKAITDRFPPELQAVLSEPPAATVMVAFPVETILDQLSTGRVEIPVADLRKASPITVFAPDTSQDQRRVEIPLQELLPRLDPALLKRNNQKRVELPEEIAGLFIKRGDPQPVLASVADGRPATATAAPAIPQQPAPPPVPRLKSDGTTENSGGESPKPLKSPEPPEPPPQLPESVSPKKSGVIAASAELQALFGSPKKEPEPQPHAPALTPAPARPAEPAQEQEAPRKRAVETPAPEPREVRPAAGSPASPAERKSIALPRTPIIDAPAIAHRPVPRTASQSGQSGHMAQAFSSALPIPPVAGSIKLPLAQISVDWPETIREELANADPEACVEFPGAELGRALKRGKVALPWRQLRQWIVPALSTPGDLLYSDALLELPLPVVAPLFMAAAAASPSPGSSRLAENEPGRRVTVDEKIPVLFAPAAKAAPMPQAVPIAQEPMPAAAPAISSKASKASGALGLDHSLPAELVERACSLHGVAGAIVSLKEGLLVAAQVPPDLQAETLAAFLPQLFSRMEQATESMQIGPLKNLMFTAGERPWQIWKAGAVFFAAMGRPGELLPAAQLKLIAAQLARHHPKGA